MAKFQKMDPKQVPQVVVLGVMLTGVLGYAGITYFAPTPAPAATAKPDERTPVTQTAALPPEGADASASILPGGSAAGHFNPDPFKPAVMPEKAENGSAPVRVQVSPPRPEPKAERMPDPLPPLPSGPLPPEPQRQPEPPVPPSVLVTGVIDTEDGEDMALVTVGQDRHLVRVGDVLVANEREFRVKRIGMGGLTIAGGNGKERYTFPIGKPEEKARASASSPAARS